MSDNTPESSPYHQSDAFVTIPDVLISHATLIYIGLSSEKADEIWGKWTNWPRDSDADPIRETDPDNGTISTKPNSEYFKLGSWEEVDESHVLHVGIDGRRRKAVQYVFNGDEEGIEWLEENGAQKIEAFPYTRD
ncbi:unnamed protein product [Periconia digitata]|uniref:Uncharacterized protein n=1 Tax=Periconia digitata TaxID=1303443 RepID=A0A9W4U7G6_9PLEO|nr:unnamed protein product [Periconia digitata]